jgi:hypothetical protein
MRRQVVTKHALGLVVSVMCLGFATYAQQPAPADWSAFLEFLGKHFKA